MDLEQSQAAVKVLLVDDHDLVRVGLRAVMDTMPEIGVQWREADTLHDAIEAYAHEPDIDLVLLDLNMPDCKGLQGLRQFLASHPQAQIAIMSGTSDDFVIGQARAMGAVGYLPKAQTPEITCRQIIALLGARTAREAGAPPLHSQPARGATTFRSQVTYDRVAELGPRHLEILELVLSGCSNQEISNASKLSLGTVKNYVSTILLALDVKSRSHLISLFR